MKQLTSIIIVNYKVEKELFDCLSSIYGSKTRTLFEIIVVDNDEESTIRNPLKNKFPKVKYVKNPVNNGYGGGNNIGASFAKGHNLFFLTLTQ